MKKRQFNMFVKIHNWHKVREAELEKEFNFV